MKIDGSALPEAVHEAAAAPQQSPPSKTTPYTVLQSSSDLEMGSGEVRLNEGAADPAGRFLFGSMTFDHTTSPGRLYSLSSGVPRATSPRWDTSVVHTDITVTNGMAWINKGKQMSVLGSSVPSGQHEKGC